MDITDNRQRAIRWTAQSIDEAREALELDRAIQDINRSAGVRNTALVMQLVPGVVEDNPVVCDTFGEAWHQHLAQHQLETVDACRTAATPLEPMVDWRKLPRNRLKIRRFFRDFQEFQLGRQGVTFIHRGHLGDTSLLSFISDVTDKRWLVQIGELAATAAIVHPAVHRFVLRTRFGINGTIAIRLTPREKECLNWAAHGRTSREISNTLGLTPATVNFFIDAAVQKLSASNRAHAAAKAVALGLISPPL